MTPGREFFFFLVTLIFFSVLLLFWKDDPELPMEKDTPVVQSVDSISYQEDNTTLDTADIKPDPVISAGKQKPFVTTPIVFAPDDSLQFSYLVSRLQRIAQFSLPLRILYFGDSQIENDRITGALRNVLQNIYGGKGAGFVPLDEYYNVNHQLMIETSSRWEIKTFQEKDFLNKSILFRNTLLTKDNPTAWFRVKRIRRARPQPNYQILKMYYTATDTCLVKVTQGSDIIYEGNLLPEEQVATLDFQFNRTPDDIRFDFVASDSLNVLGLSFETANGVLVDNIALRGLSYPMFEWSDQQTIKQMLEQVNVGLFVLHFGVNLVPYESDNDYHYFKVHFQRQVSFLKKIKPEVPVLIVGVSDMAYKQGGQFVSYGNIPRIKQIQYEIAMKNQAAFWDLQAFMGGNGAMVDWVRHSPALGRKDYVHFSKRGASLIGKELARSIMEEINQKHDSIRRLND